MSSELKDLIQKIFVINYDDRLSLDQILAHPFFAQDEPVKENLQTRAKSEAKGGFSVIKGIFSKEKDKKTPGRSSRLKEEDKNLTTRSNSC